MDFDHVLVIGFGGPTRLEEVRPFLEEVTRGRNIPEERLREVLHHYEMVGGYSPYNTYTFQLVDQLKKALASSQINLPVFVGMRNWHPFLKETLSDIKRNGFRKGIGIILAPHRSETSFERYVQNVEDAKQFTHAREIQYTYLDPWHRHPLFIQAQADEVRKVWMRLQEDEREKVYLLFTAHSIPLTMARQSRYAEEFEESSALAAKELGHSKWSVAYQSRSGSPREPWLEPDVLSCFYEMAARNEKDVMLIPIGFLSDNVEVLYDLDIEARQEAEKMGLRYFRARSVSDHPKFVEMFKLLIQEHLTQPPSHLFQAGIRQP